jgi:hypothetical protein
MECCGKPSTNADLMSHVTMMQVQPLHLHHGQTHHLSPCAQEMEGIKPGDDFPEHPFRDSKNSYVSMWCHHRTWPDTVDTTTCPGVMFKNINLFSENTLLCMEPSSRGGIDSRSDK